jgi:hypothetical protein
MMPPLHRAEMRLWRYRFGNINTRGGIVISGVGRHFMHGFCEEHIEEFLFGPGVLSVGLGIMYTWMMDLMKT